VVSRASLKAAFQRSSQAIAVVRVAEQQQKPSSSLFVEGAAVSGNATPASSSGWLFASATHSKRTSYSSCGLGSPLSRPAGPQPLPQSTSAAALANGCSGAGDDAALEDGQQQQQQQQQQQREAPPAGVHTSPRERSATPGGGATSRRNSRQEDGPSFALRSSSAHLRIRGPHSTWDLLGEDESHMPQWGSSGPATSAAGLVGGTDEVPLARPAPLACMPTGAQGPGVVAAVMRAASVRSDVNAAAAVAAAVAAADAMSQPPPSYYTPGLSGPRRRNSASGGERRLSLSGAVAVDPVEAEQLARLEPVFLNRPLQSMLDVKTLEEYTFVMEKQMLRNPMLVLLLENSVRWVRWIVDEWLGCACATYLGCMHALIQPCLMRRSTAHNTSTRRLLAGKATSVRQYMPYFTSPSTRFVATQSTFISLQITTCGFLDEEDGSISPALFLWYNAPSSQLELTAQLKRDYMALAHIPSIVTVLASDGRVLHQNGERVGGVVGW